MRDNSFSRMIKIVEEEKEILVEDLMNRLNLNYQTCHRYANHLFWIWGGIVYSEKPNKEVNGKTIYE